jgi:nucleoside-diphosphate-sugar epimerase
MKRVLVTGATGFVGQRLCEVLKTSGYQVIGAVRKVSDALDIEQVSIGEINDQTDWTVALKDIDYVVHCAARVHVMQETVSDPLREFRRVNVAGTKRLVEAAKTAGIQRLIFLSSIKVNGEKTSIGFPFSPLNTADPQDPYGVSKKEAEDCIQQLCKGSTLDYVIIRPPLIYGKGVKANFQKLINLASKNLPVPFGCLNNKRSLVYIDNLCDLIRVCLDHPKATNQTFLASDGQDLTVKDLYRLLSRLQGAKGIMVPVPIVLLKMLGFITGKRAQVDRLTDSLQIDKDHLKTQLSWQAPVGVEKAMALTVSSQED